MRLFAIGCFAVAFFYGWTAADALRTGTVRALAGDSEIAQRREDPHSRFARFLLARWLACGGFAALGVVMQVMAVRFEKLESDERK